MEEKKCVITCCDEDCPKCKFPETLTIRDELTGKPLGKMCSTFRSGKCSYFVLFEQ